MTHAIPASLHQDGWWLDDTATPATGSASPPGITDTQRAQGPFGPRATALIALLILADLLFWQRTPGVSLALFAGALFVAATWDVRPRHALRGPTALLILSALPVVEYVQTLSVAFLAAGLGGALVWARLRAEGQNARRGVLIGLAWVCRLPARWAALLTPKVWTQALRQTASGPLRLSVRTTLRDWAFPLGGALVFAALILQANPLIAETLEWRGDVAALVRRGLFWAGIAVLIWPLLDRALPEPRDLSQTALPPVGRWLGIHRASVLRALVTFNLLIAVQTLTDVGILIGGAALPEGMSYATYAHRGAYPLLVTALLAGAFALAARPFLEEHRAIRPLMLLWLAQNVGICLAAMLRLDTYVDAYGLTYLRLYALIWMGLVAAGLALMGWQMARGRSNAWMLWRAAGMGLLTLYLCCFVNFAQIIATTNLRAVPQVPLDRAYLCRLEPMATGAIYAHGPGVISLDGLACKDLPEVGGWRAPWSQNRPQDGTANWTEWGFRKARVAAYARAAKEGL